MLLRLLCGALAASVAYTQPTTVKERAAAAPTVTIQNGTVVGSTSNNVDSFLGIPFAQPPVGNLRLRPPLPLNQSFGTFDATKKPAVCPQFLISTGEGLDSLPTEALGYILDLPFFNTVLNENEDCLTINVQRPSTATSSSKLPVVFWIFGGGFELGGTELPQYSGTDLIQRSTTLGAEVIYVAVNYRVASFGFLAGKELQQEGSTNLGLRDQRLGLEWVAENIAAFGGDPDRVTIWGESAGAISVFDHMLINGGDNTYNGKPLFYGAIMNSGSAVPALDVASDKAQYIYDTVVQNAGCASASDSVACLRALPLEKFRDASNSVPALFSYQSVELAYLPRPDPSDNFFATSPSIESTQNLVAKIPVIIGDQEDEGTLFSLEQGNITTTQELVDYLKGYFTLASEEDIQGLVDTYPDDPSAGSPFRTGPLNQLYPQYKRLAAILGDLTFTLTRRAVLDALNAGDPSNPTWSYLSSWFTYLPIVGTLHGSDLLEIYLGGIPFKNPQNVFFDKYISFFNYLEPNHFDSTSGLINWPQWTNESLSMLQINAFSNDIIQDNFRQESYEYILAHSDVLFV